MSCFSLSLFYSTKSENRRVEEVLPKREGQEKVVGE
jgi:hypothetical protein